MFERPFLAGAIALPFLLWAGGAPVSGAADLNGLETLTGSWTLVGPDGEPLDFRATYDVVAGGAAVIETLFVDSPEETVTIYHRDGNRVTATQLSARAKPIHLVPAGSRDRDALRFDVETKARAGELTGVQVTRLGDESLRVEWFLARDAGDPDVRTLELRRETDVRELAAEVSRMRTSLASLQLELDRRIKREVSISEKGERTRVLLETRTRPAGPGWNVSGVPFRIYLHEQTVNFASTFAAGGDEGLTVAHYALEPGPDCRLEFSVIGGHGYVAVVLEEKAPARRIKAIPEFSAELLNGSYGAVVERIVGGHWKEPRAVAWDLSRFEGKALRIYVVDAETNHYGQIGVSDFRILESAN